MNSRPASRKIGHVFLVEDDEDVRELLRLNLINACFTVEAYASATDFLDQFKPDAQGCLVTDVQMAPMDGVELVQTLRGRKIDIPIVVMTGYADVGLAVKAMKVGAECEDIRLRMVSLSARERDVLDLIGSGRTSRQIAELLDISARTVDVHRANIMTKMGAARLAQLVRMTTLVKVAAG